MQPTLIPILVVLAIIALILATPKARAFLKVGFAMRKDDADTRRAGRAVNIWPDAYHDAVAGALTGRFVIDDRTWSDLDLDQVFEKLDYTRCRPGQQYLRHLLRAPHATPGPVAQLNRDIARFDADDAAGTDIRQALENTDDRRASFLASLIYGDLPDRPAFWWMFPLLTLSAIGFASSIYFWPRAILGLLAVTIINIALQVFYRPRVDGLIPAIHQIPAFLRTAELLGRLRTPLFTTERETLKHGVGQLGVLRSATMWLKFEPSQQNNELVAALYTYVNLLLLIDLNAFAFAINKAKRARPVLQKMFEVIGYIDAVQSIAAWRKSVPQWTTPEFTSAQKMIDVNGLVHPLVTNAVPNNVTLRNSSALITGSNMSGKTTFIRALGVNAVLAQSMGTVVATRWHAPMFRTSSSIGRSDSVLEGKSYYLAEVESIRSLIERKGDGAQHLFIIDELFRGTNTAERVAGAYAVLEYLNRGEDIVVVATHDTELLGMLGDAYAPLHFREEIAGDTLTFDFTLRDGQATTRNAIALLELMKYPPEVVARARSVVG